MVNFKGQKLLILAGAGAHVKLVQAAKELGVYTIVSDCLPLEKSPAKLIADEHWELDITDIETIVSHCQNKNVNGVLAGWIDPCQIPYCHICEKLSVPCYGNKEQFHKLSNKHAFKQLCIENGLDVIPEYKKSNIEEIIYPVFVKPVDSRGSRGQSICYNKKELINAINFAEQESSNGDILIEKYIKDKNSFQVTYFFIDGEAYLLRTCDGYKGYIEDNLDKVALCSISPSVHTQHYIDTTNKKVINMMKSIGYRNGPVMLQGFYDEGAYRFYDPGLRFPGVDFDSIYADVTGINVMKLMVEFALTGKIRRPSINSNDVFLKGKTAAVLFPTISAGKVGRILGLNNLDNDSRVYSLTMRHNIGDEVIWSYNVNQRLAEIDVLCSDKESLKAFIKETYKSIEILDESGNNMLYKPFDSNRIK